HRVARAGARVQDRPAGDPPAPRGGARGPRRPLRRPRVPRRGPAGRGHAARSPATAGRGVDRRRARRRGTSLAVHWPYTLDFSESFFAAMSCTGMLLTALLLFWRSGGKASRGLMLLAVWLAVVASAVGPALGALGPKPEHDTFRHVLVASALLGTIACVLALRPIISVFAVLSAIPVWLVGDFVTDSDGELTGLQLAWLGLLIGLLMRKGRPRSIEPPESATEGSYASHDWLVFFVATALAALVGVFVMHRRDGAADEWGYTFQAAVFAKGRAYAEMP